MNTSARLRKGFTLIELLIVIVIIGILAVGLVPKVIDAPKRARDTVRKKDLQSIQTALMSYAADHDGTYPAPAGVCVSGIANTIKQYFSGGAVPVDPIATRVTYPGNCVNGSYIYNTLSNGGVKCLVLAAPMEVLGGGNANRSFGPPGNGVWDSNACTVSDYENTAGGSRDYYYIVQNY